MRIVVLAVTFTMASVLLAAGMEKARQLTSFVSMLRELGLERGAKLAAMTVIAIEAAVALGIIFQPSSVFTASGVLTLASSFAAAGIIGMRRERPIRCSCFGPYGDSALGKNQLLAFPLWIAGALLLFWQEPVAPAARPALFAVMALTLAALRLKAAYREAVRARGDRLSAKEMYAWLR